MSGFDEDDISVECNRCAARARWAVANLEGDAMDPYVRWHACGRHLHAVLDSAPWEVDAVQVYDLAAPVGKA